MNFQGKITSISQIKTGESNGKEWASLDFEVTESNPNNELYPQIGLFAYFKNGEYCKYAKDFNNTFKVGDEVNVEFNLKCIKYKKDDEDRKFYKTECWKVEKAVSTDAPPVNDAPPTSQNNEPDDLPF